MGVTLRPHQLEASTKIDELWRSARNVVSVLPTGAGKCLGKDTPVLMFDGTIKHVQDVKTGDLLMGVDSTPRKVLSTCTGREQLYKVVPVKGDPYIVNESHIISLKQTGLKSGQKGKGEIVNISVRDYLDKSDTFKHTHKGWRTGVDFETKEHSDFLPPYLLGLWLGDGNSRKPTVTTADNEIADYIKRFCFNHAGMTLRIEEMECNKASNYHITDKYERAKTNRVKEQLRNYDLLQNKHVPHDYLTGDRKQRLQLLAGIIDSDGHYDGKILDVIFKSKRLTDDLAYLCRSLGLAAYVKECKKTCTNTNATGVYYRISISGDFTDIPCKLKRHQFKPRKQKKSVLVTGIKVEKLEVGDYYGFEISGDRMFLLGDFTVTHNTILMASKAAQEVEAGGVVVIFAHRDVLLEQISEALCLFGLQHNFYTSQKTQNRITTRNHVKFGDSFYNQQARVIVASVDTFFRRDLTTIAPLVTLWMMDETHHLLDSSKWHRCIDPLINARGLGVTATPIRADKKGLGRHADGVFDAMTVGATMHQLITNGMLSPYRVYTPPSRLDLTGVNTTSSGDYNNTKLAAATDKSDITGDAIEHYLKLAEGKQAICFTVNIEHGEHVAEQFRKAGVKAVNLSSKTPDAERDKRVQEFRDGHIQVLVNCDLFGEGFDVPAVECVIMLRKTQSYSLFKQQFGRALRVCEGKDFGILIDHVGNVEHFMSEFNLQYPHDDPEWTLDRLNKKKKGVNKPAVGRICPKCFARYVPSTHNNHQCPYCHHVETKEEELDALKKFQAKAGNLVEMEIDVITNLLNKRDQVMKDPEQLRRQMNFGGAPAIAVNSAVVNHKKRRDAQLILQDLIQSWCSRRYREEEVTDVKAVQQAFELEFGVNILKAQVLSERETLQLVDKIRG